MPVRMGAIGAVRCEAQDRTYRPAARANGEGRQDTKEPLMSSRATARDLLRGPRG